tara:strand:+ start:408 stop:827 length:420 start_codon:yes stop_codon:yes gene_type:complete
MHAQYAQLINATASQLQAAVMRGDATDDARREMRLGEDNRTLFLAHCGLNSLDDAWRTARVVARTKRSAIVRVGDLHLFLNRFGVATYLLPLEIPIGGFTMSQHSLLDAAPLLSVIDAARDGYDRHDTVYRYNECALAA